MTRLRTGNRTGNVLLDVLLALAILGLMALGLGGALREAARSESRWRLREDEVARADRLLSAYAIMDRPALERRMGTNRHGVFLVRVSRHSGSLLRLDVSDTLAPNVALLSTLIYRGAAR